MRFLGKKAHGNFTLGPVFETGSQLAGEVAVRLLA